MSTYYLDLNGARVVTVDVQIPYLGCWVADVELALPGNFSGPQVLTIGNLTLAGATVRGGDFAGEHKAQLVGGFGGWRKTIPAQAYHNPGGILASTILRDAATIVGEQVNVVTDSTVGQFWNRLTGAAMAQLRLLAPLWWTDPATGVTQVNAVRPSTAIGSDFEVLEFAPNKGRFAIATEDPASWMPANTFTSPFMTSTATIASTRIVSADDGAMHLSVLAE